MSIQDGKFSLLNDEQRVATRVRVEHQPVVSQRSLPLDPPNTHEELRCLSPKIIGTLKMKETNSKRWAFAKKENSDPINFQGYIYPTDHHRKLTR